MRDLRTLTLFTLSAALYGALPVAYLLGGGGDPAQVAALVSLFISGAPVLLLSSGHARRLFFRMVRDPGLLGLAALNTVSFLLSLRLMFIALGDGNPGVVAVLVEVWPVFQVYLLALMMRDPGRVGLFRMIVFGIGGVFGVSYLSYDGGEIPIIPVLTALGSALMMGLASSTKAIAVIRMRDRHDASPLMATLFLKFLALPVALIVAFPYMGLDLFSGSVGMSALLIAALTFGSALAATIGTYAMRNVSSFLLFLLTPLFGLVFLSLIGDVKFGPAGPFGVLILLSLNALALIPARPARLV